ncbi:MAG: hypothetical protein LBD91_02740 [Prevotellaceae bacterium]|jgi:hypothetical protein|nr:hypothetical protein [Prevotellaceae bacterium]
MLRLIEKHSSISVVGMAKNTGKTTCLNHLIRRLRNEGRHCAVTSIGVDGEERDVLYRTPKPRITVHEGMLFVTSETDFTNRECPAETLAVSDRSTPLGRLVTARAQGTGTVVLSGPSDSQWLCETLADLKRRGASLTLVDGALSRMSLASPAVTDALILCTGAALTGILPELIRQTQFRCTLIDLNAVEPPLAAPLQMLGSGVWIFDEINGNHLKLTNSVFTGYETAGYPVTAEGSLPAEYPVAAPTLYVSGAVTEPFFKTLSARRYAGTTLIVRDFTRLFIEPATYEKFTRRGGHIRVLQKAALLAVCTNPVAPQGQRFDPLLLRNALRNALPWPVYDVMQKD